MEIEKLIKELESQILASERFDNDLDEVSFERKKGVIISCNKAKELLKLVKQTKKLLEFIKEVDNDDN